MEISSINGDIDKWLWINTYENTIFRGMNIHLPAISGALIGE